MSLWSFRNFCIVALILLTLTIAFKLSWWPFAIAFFVMAIAFIVLNSWQEMAALRKEVPAAMRRLGTEKWVPLHQLCDSIARSRAQKQKRYPTLEDEPTLVYVADILGEMIVAGTVEMRPRMAHDHAFGDEYRLKETDTAMVGC